MTWNRDKKKPRRSGVKVRGNSHGQGVQFGLSQLTHNQLAPVLRQLPHIPQFEQGMRIRLMQAVRATAGLPPVRLISRASSSSPRTASYLPQPYNAALRLRIVVVLLRVETLGPRSAGPLSVRPCGRGAACSPACCLREHQAGRCRRRRSRCLPRRDEPAVAPC